MYDFDKLPPLPHSHLHGTRCARCIPRVRSTPSISTVRHPAFSKICGLSWEDPEETVEYKHRCCTWRIDSMGTFCNTFSFSRGTFGRQRLLWAFSFSRCDGMLSSSGCIYKTNTRKSIHSDLKYMRMDLGFPSYIFKGSEKFRRSTWCDNVLLWAQCAWGARAYTAIVYKISTRTSHWLSNKIVCQYGANAFHGTISDFPGAFSTCAPRTTTF